MKRIIDAVAGDPEMRWNKTTRERTFPADANAIREALIAEYGVDAALAALVNQGFSPTGEYRYAAQPLFDLAISRRAVRRAKRNR